MWVIKMGSSNYQQALLLIHDLEDEYGSVLYVSNDNLELRQVHKLLNVKEKLNHKRVYNLNKQGYSVSQIAQIVGNTSRTVYNYLKNNHIRPKCSFKYQVTVPDLSHNIYTTSLINLANIICHTQSINLAKCAVKQLKARGCLIKKIKSIWCEIPNGDYYCLPYFDKIITKNGLDSYIYNT
jgi:hypothetical protein